MQNIYITLAHLQQVKYLKQYLIQFFPSENAIAFGERQLLSIRKGPLIVNVFRLNAGSQCTSLGCCNQHLTGSDTLRKFLVNVEASLRVPCSGFQSVHASKQKCGDGATAETTEFLNHIIFPTIKYLIIFISAFPHPPSFLPPLKIFCCILLHMQHLLLSKQQIYSLYLSLILLVSLFLL